MEYMLWAIMSLSIFSAARAQEYFAVVPKELRTGMFYKVDVELLHSPSSNISVDISIRESARLPASLAWDTAAMTLSFGEAETSKTGKAMVPLDLHNEAKYYVILEFNGLNIQPVYKEVVVVRPESAIFVQTDKGIYKPGDLVQWRVLNLDPDLKPKREIIRVQIKDARDNIIMDETNVATEDGNTALMKGDIPVSDDPILGTYRIIVETSTGYTDATFDIAKYVLPKFEVKLNLGMDYIVLKSQIDIRGEVKAIYTYGQLVNGNMSLFVDGTKVKEVVEFEGRSTFDISLNSSAFNIQGTQKAISVYAEVSELNTGIGANATKMITIFTSYFAASVVNPLPYLFDVDTEYSFNVTLTTPQGGALTDWDDLRYGSHNLEHYRLKWKVYTFFGTEITESHNVSDNPTRVIVPYTSKEGEVVQLNNIQVWFVYVDMNNTEIDGIKTVAKPLKYVSDSGEKVSVEVMEAGIQNSKCFQIAPMIAGDRVYYQIINNYYAEEINKYTSEDGHCFSLTRNHSPKSMVVVYTIHQYGNGQSELLTASTVFIAPWVPPQQLTVEISPPIQRPGKEVEIVIQAEGRALVGVSGVDKSTTLLAHTNDISSKKIQESVQRFRMFERPPKQNSFTARKRSASILPLKIIQDAGLDVMTDVSIYGVTPTLVTTTTAPPTSTKNTMTTRRLTTTGWWWDGAHTTTSHPATTGWRWHTTTPSLQHIWPGVQFTSSRPELLPGPTTQPAEEDDTKFDINITPSEIRTEFPETWLWEIIETNDKGYISLTKDVPDTITNWIVNSFALNEMNGLGLAQTKEVTVFQDFFISMNLPYSVVRGEIVTLDILVFNYKTTYITVIVELAEGPEYLTVKSKRRKEIMIAPGSSGILQTPIKAIKVGDILLTANAMEKNNKNNVDGVERTLLVKPEGRKVTYSKELKLTIPDDQGEVSFDLRAFFTESNIVVDSLRMYMRVTGDMLGPSIENIEGKIQMPYGCGEQNIKSLTPSIFVGKYLKTIERFDPQIRTKVAKVCGTGYRKELNYRHSDGSFSAFGERANLCGCGSSRATKGSTWLTAYVLKTFSLLANEELTYVSRDVLSSAYRYLVEVSDKYSEFQYFSELGNLIHTEMQGGTSSGIGFTAFCMIAISEYKAFALNESVVQEIEPQLLSASDWIRGKLSALLNDQKPYQLAISSYALLKASTRYGDENQQAAVELLQVFEQVKDGQELLPMECPRIYTLRMACIQGHVMNFDLCINNTNCTDGQMCCDIPCGTTKVCATPRRPYSRIPAPTQVEMYGYALLAYLALADREADPTKLAEIKTNATMKMSWLISKRKTGGFFESTQDTAVALEALSRFAITFPESTETNFLVRAKSKGQYVSMPIRMTSQNYTSLAEEKLTITEKTNDLSIEVAGSSGMAFVTIEAIYNVNDDVPDSPLILTLDSNVTVTVGGGNVLRQCVRANADSNASIGPMVVVTLSLQSGTKYDGVDQNINERSSRKVEANEENNSVSVYYMNDNDDNFTEERCIDVHYTNEYNVQNRQPGLSIARDYYNSENNVEVMYNVASNEEVVEEEDDWVEMTTPCTSCTHTAGGSVLQKNVFLLLVAIVASKCAYE